MATGCVCLCVFDFACVCMCVCVCIKFPYFVYAMNLLNFLIRIFYLLLVWGGGFCVLNVFHLFAAHPGVAAAFRQLSFVTFVHLIPTFLLQNYL